MVWSPFYTLKGPFKCKDQGRENPEQGGPVGGAAGMKLPRVVQSQLGRNHCPCPCGALIYCELSG